jgi:hypothetical protein
MTKQVPILSGWALSAPPGTCELCGRRSGFVLLVSGIWCHSHCWRQRRRRRDRLVKERRAEAR